MTGADVSNSPEETGEGGSRGTKQGRRGESGRAEDQRTGIRQGGRKSRLRGRHKVLIRFNGEGRSGRERQRETEKKKEAGGRDRSERGERETKKFEGEVIDQERRQIERERERQTGRQTDRQTDRQTERDAMNERNERGTQIVERQHADEGGPKQFLRPRSLPRDNHSTSLV